MEPRREVTEHLVSEGLARLPFGKEEQQQVQRRATTNSSIKSNSHLSVLLGKSKTGNLRQSMCCISGYIIVCNKIAWNGKRPLESASGSLLENLGLFAYACL